MRPRGRGKHGDHLVQDDRTGFTEWASDCVKEWNGALVHRRHYEARHPQDFIRARRDTSAQIRDARPELSIADSNFSGPLSTTIAEGVETERYAPMGALGQFALGAAEEGSETNVAGALAITVDSTSAMSAGDSVGIFLNSGDRHLTTITRVDSASVLAIADALPGSVSVGNVVVNYDASV